jgi:2-polyprenyl-3-methyl-5-hydroxy-6-metoxy-1,4-benzoquinol methylase
VTLDAMYLEKTSQYYASERRDMLPFIPKGVSTLLDVGCSSGAFGAIVKSERACSVVGVEPHGPAAQEASKRLDYVLNAGFPLSSDQLVALGRFDCITFNDVLEHIIDPWAALDQAKALLNPGGAIVASLPNVRHYPTLRKLVLSGEWKYDAEGVLDRTHLRFFTPSSMRSLFEDSGLDVVTITPMGWTNFPLWLSVINRLASRRFQDSHHMYFACVARVRG